MPSSSHMQKHSWICAAIHCPYHFLGAMCKGEKVLICEYDLVHPLYPQMRLIPSFFHFWFQFWEKELSAEVNKRNCTKIFVQFLRFAGFAIMPRYLKKKIKKITLSTENIVITYYCMRSILEEMKNVSVMLWWPSLKWQLNLLIAHWDLQTEKCILLATQSLNNQWGKRYFLVAKICLPPAIWSWYLWKGLHPAFWLLDDSWGPSGSDQNPQAYRTQTFLFLFKFSELLFIFNPLWNDSNEDWMLPVFRMFPKRRVVPSKNHLYP